MGVDIMTEPRRPLHGRTVRWARNSVITLGLTALLALSYHSATGSSSDAAVSHTGHAAELASMQRPGPEGPPSAPEQPAAGGNANASAQRNGNAQPGQADEEDPANRPQTSLQDAAGREHPVGAANPAPQAPLPQLREKVLPSQVLESGATGYGGCLLEYGENGQCVPAVPPSLASHVQDMKAAGGNPNAMEHRWSCTELRQYFKDGVALRQAGTDPQKLDANGDGKACGAGDR